MTIKQARELARKYGVRMSEDGELFTRPNNIRDRREEDERNSLKHDITDLHASGLIRTELCVQEKVTLRNDDGDRAKTIMTKSATTYYTRD